MSGNNPLDFISDPEWGGTRADKAAECAAATHSVLVAIVLGLVAAKAVDGDALRTFLGNLVMDLTPAERRGAYGHSLITLLASLSASVPDALTDRGKLRQ